MTADIKFELKNLLPGTPWNDIEDEHNFGRMMIRALDSQDVDLVFFHRTKTDEDADYSYGIVLEFRHQCTNLYYVLIDITDAQCETWYEADVYQRRRMMAEAIDASTVVGDVGSLKALMLGFGCCHEDNFD